MKTCTRCKESKEESEFIVRADRPGKTQSHCKPCNTKRISEVNKRSRLKNRAVLNLKAKQARLKNPELFAQKRRNYKASLGPWAFRRRYGASVAELEKMEEDQGRLCAICREKKKLSVDHDHTTGKVRALLCHSCNSAVGMVKDSVSIAEAVVEYLKKHLGSNYLA